MQSMDKITVCDNCLCASCWHGVFMCWESQGAGTIDMEIPELEKLGLEHPDNWERLPPHPKESE